MEAGRKVCYFVFLGTYTSINYKRALAIIMKKLGMNFLNVGNTSVMADYKSFNLKSFVWYGEKFKITIVHDFGLITHPKFEWREGTHEIDKKLMESIRKKLNSQMKKSYCRRMFAYDISEQEFNIRQDHYIIKEEELEKLLEPLIADIQLFLNAETISLFNNYF